MVVLLWNVNSYKAHQNWIRDLIIINTFSVLLRGFGLLEVMNQRVLKGCLGSCEL